MIQEFCPTCGEELVYIGAGDWKCPKCGEELCLGYDDEGESTSECLSSDEAALIWGSSGCDEDYLFGYSEDELKQHF